MALMHQKTAGQRVTRCYLQVYDIPLPLVVAMPMVFIPIGNDHRLKTTVVDGSGLPAGLDPGHALPSPLSAPSSGRRNPSPTGGPGHRV